MEHYAQEVDRLEPVLWLTNTLCGDCSVPEGLSLLCTLSPSRGYTCSPARERQQPHGVQTSEHPQGFLSLVYSVHMALLARPVSGAAAEGSALVQLS